MQRFKACLAFATVAVVVTFSSLAHADETGRWVTASGNLEVEIAPCGGALCGTVVKVLGDRSMMATTGQPMQPADDKPALGMKVLSDLRPVEGGKWQGRIYNRENGQTYDCLLSLSAPDQLTVHAYQGTPAMGRTQVWQRAAEAMQ